MRRHGLCLFYKLRDKVRTTRVAQVAEQEIKGRPGFEWARNNAASHTGYKQWMNKGYAQSRCYELANSRTCGGRQNDVRGDVEIGLEGVPVEEDRDAFLEEACDAAAAAASKGGGNEEKLREAVRLAVRRVATDWTGKKPVVSVLIVRI